MPIGLSSEFIDRTQAYQITLIELARILGVILFILFYCSLYLSVPSVKKRIPKKLRWLHCLLGTLPLFLLIVHNMILHGYVLSTWDFFSIESWANATFHWGAVIFTIPLTPYDLGQFTAYLCVPAFVVVTITGIGPIIKRRHLRKLHKLLVFVSLALMLIHIQLLVHLYYIRNPIGFLLLNIGAIGFYFLLKYYPALIRKYRNENSTTVPQDAQ
jgi:hypothetical protein